MTSSDFNDLFQDKHLQEPHFIEADLLGSDLDAQPTVLGSELGGLGNLAEHAIGVHACYISHSEPYTIRAHLQLEKFTMQPFCIWRRESCIVESSPC